MRIRLPELMRAANIETAYALSMRSDGRISMSTAHRLVRASGALRYLDAELLEVLCDVFEVGPDALLTREPPSKPTTKRPAAKKRARKKSAPK